MTEFVGGLATLLHHERGQRAQPLLEALLDTRCGDHPSDVRDVADEILRASAPWALELADAAAMLIQAAGTERDKRLFVYSTLHPTPRSLGQLAHDEGVSSTRAGQIVHRADRRVRNALDASPGPLSWAVRAVRSRLGAVTTEDHVAALLSHIGASQSPASELVPWLAGPYITMPHHPGWMAVEPRQMATRTAACVAEDGGVRRLSDVTAELADLGISADRLVPWLAANGAVVVHDLAVRVSGPMPDAAERILDARGTARTAEEIAADLATGGRVVDESALDVALGGRRFARSASGAVGLAAWPTQEQSRAKKPRRQPAKPGRAAPRRTRAEKPKPAATTQRLWLWVKIDEEALRGSEAAVPVALVEGLGLAPLTRRTFSSRWGPVALAHEGPHPTRGSVRAVALAAGARPDDTLLLGFSATGDVVIEVRRGTGQVSPPDVSGAAALLFPETASGGAQ